MDPVGLVAASVVAGMVGGGLAYGHWRANRQWRTAAHTLRGRLDRVHGKRCIVATVRGVPLTLLERGDDRPTVLVDGLPGPACDLRVTEHRWLEWPRGPDVVVGDDTFDRQWYVTSRQPALARAWLAPVVRTAMLDGVDHVIAGRRLQLTARPMPADAASLVLLAHSAATIARAGVRLVERWRAAAEAHGGTVEDDLVASFAAAATPIAIAADPDADVTRVRCAAPPGTWDHNDTFVVTAAAPPGGFEALDEVREASGLPPPLALFAVDRRRALARLSREVLEGLRDAAPRSVSVECEAVTVVLDAIEPDLERWRGAMKLATALARPAVGGTWR